MPLSAAALARSQSPQRKDIGNGKIVLRSLQAVPVAELPLLPPSLQQAGDHAFARVDVAAVDNVAPACCRKRGGRTEECPFGTINKGLEAREIQKIGTIEILSRT